MKSELVVEPISNGFTPAIALIANVALGDVVPTPTLPPFVTMKLVCVEEPIANAGPLIPFGFTESSAHGVVVPTPRKPAEVIVVVPVWPAAKMLARKDDAKSDVDVAPVVVERLAVSPPLKASCVVVAFEGNR